MDPVQYHGATYLSVYLGTSLTSIHNWRNDAPSGFPGPAVTVTGITGMRPVFGWSDAQLPGLRDWYAKRFKLDEVTAAERWKAIDTNLDAGETSAKKPENQCKGQSLLFTVPNQRSAA